MTTYTIPTERDDGHWTDNLGRRASHYRASGHRADQHLAFPRPYLVTKSNQDGIG